MHNVHLPGNLTLFSKVLNFADDVEYHVITQMKRDLDALGRVKKSYLFLNLTFYGQISFQM